MTRLPTLLLLAATAAATTTLPAQLHLPCGPTGTAHITADGLHITPDTTHNNHPHLTFTAISARRGNHNLLTLPSKTPPHRHAHRVHIAHSADIVERFEPHPTGVEISWTFASRPEGDGDLSIHYTIQGATAAAGNTHGVAFTLPSGQHIRVGAVTGVDADGDTCAGELHFTDDTLTMSLPASFVDAATYPLVLDPLVGTTLTIDATTPAGLLSPDAAYDASIDRVTVAHLRRYGPSDTRVRASTIAPGGWISGIHTLGSQGTAYDPQIANLGSGDRWGVVWTDATHGAGRLCFEVVYQWGTYAFTVLENGFPGRFQSADIGAEVDAPLGSGRGFVVVYEDNQLNAIRTRRVWFDANNNVQVSQPITLWADGPLATFHAPAISRAAGADGRLIVVAQQQSPLAALPAIVGRVVSTDLATLGPPRVVFSAIDRSASAPDVDGYAGRGIAACQFASTTTPANGVWFAPVWVAADGQSLEVGDEHTVGATATTNAELPAVGYAPGKSWIGYRFQEPASTPASGLRVMGVDANTCVDCSDTTSLSIRQTYFADLDICVATPTSGGATARDDAVAVVVNHYMAGYDLDSTANGGGIANLGGGCGGGGAQSFSANPSIGRNRFACTLSGLPPTALLTVFNLAPLGGSLGCGPCTWTPFSFTVALPLIGGGAEVAFAIPCQPGLIGVAMETQWTSLDPSQAPCPFASGFVLSDRSLLTFGQ